MVNLSSPPANFKPSYRIGEYVTRYPVSIIPKAMARLSPSSSRWNSSSGIHGNAAQSTRTSWLEPFYSIETRHAKSPAQNFYGNPVQASLPAHRRSFAPEWQCPVNTEWHNEVLQKAESFYDQHTHSVTDLAPGARVAIQNPTSKSWDVVTVVSPYRRYFVRTQSGRVLVCNRWFLFANILLSQFVPQLDEPKSYQNGSSTSDHLLPRIKCQTR